MDGVFLWIHHVPPYALSTVLVYALSVYHSTDFETCPKINVYYCSALCNDGQSSRLAHVRTPVRVAPGGGTYVALAPTGGGWAAASETSGITLLYVCMCTD